MLDEEKDNAEEGGEERKYGWKIRRKTSQRKVKEEEEEEK